MLARLQKFVTLTLCVLAAAWAAYFVHLRQFLPAIGGALLIIFGYAIVLAGEFALLRWVNRTDSAPPADLGALVNAWRGEVAGAAQVFFWRQPFRSRSIPDRLSDPPKGSKGIVFVHGFVCNRAIWNPWLRRLHAHGVPFIAVNLEPVFAGIDNYVSTIEAAVRRIEALTDGRPIVVAHSMGGLAVRAWLAAGRRDARSQQVVTIGTPHRGTVLARIALAPNARQMRRQSAWLRALEQREHGELFASFTCYYSHCDNVVMPASTATLPGADNRHLPGVAHVRMATDERIFQDLLDRVRHDPRTVTDLD